MAQAPVVVPYAVTQLATGVSVDAALTTSQTVYTSPTGMKCVPLFFVFRDSAGTINAATTVSVGTSASATAYLNASTVLQSMLTSTGPVVLPAYGSSVATATAYQPSASNFAVLFAGTQTSNKMVKVDVIGYITAI